MGDGCGTADGIILMFSAKQIYMVSIYSPESYDLAVLVLNIARLLPRASKRQRRGQVDCPEVTSGDYGPVGFSFFSDSGR